MAESSVLRRRAIQLAALVGVLVLAFWGAHRWSAARSVDDPQTPERDPGALGFHPIDPHLPLTRSHHGVRRVAGVVVMNGQPVAGATVQLASTLPTDTTGSSVSRTTDAGGHFDFGPQPTTTYVVAADAPHVTGASKTIDLRDSKLEPPPDQLRLVLHPCTASIHGTVRDASHAAIASAHVSRDDETFERVSGVDTDATGHFELCVPESTTTVSVRASGYASVEHEVSAFGPVRHDFMLVPEATVEGHVVRAGDRAPVIDAIVELQPDLYLLGPILHARTDADGHFHFEGAAPGRHNITATAEHLATVRAISIVAEVGIAKEQVTCVLEPVSTVEGTVVDRSSRDPVPNVRVLLTQTKHGAPSSTLTATSRNDGSFTFEHAVFGTYTAVLMTAATARQLDKPETPVVVDRSEVSGVVLEFDRGASISARMRKSIEVDSIG